MANDPPTFAIPPGFLGIGRRERDAAIAVAGIPLDIGTTNRSGARFGPQAIRHASRMLVDGCVYRKPHPAMNSVLADENPCSCARIPCSAEIIPCFVE